MSLRMQGKDFALHECKTQRAPDFQSASGTFGSPKKFVPAGQTRRIEIADGCVETFCRRVGKMSKDDWRETETSPYKRGDQTEPGGVDAGLAGVDSVGPPNSGAGVNAALVTLYWQAGERLRTEVLKVDRVEYGEEILSKVSKELGWAHFFEQLPLKKHLQRDFYAEMRRIEQKSSALVWVLDAWLYNLRTVTQADFQTIIADTSKRIEAHIQWSGDDDHFPALEFKVDVLSDSGYPLVMKGSYNPLAQTLSYVLIHRLAGRIFALDIGKDHHNPTCETAGEKHKHTWRQGLRDKFAYAPEDITATLENPVDVWDQFCREAGIQHNGLDVPEHQIPPGIF